MYRFIILLIMVFGVIRAQNIQLAPSVPKTEEFFGIKVTDDFRNLENLQDAFTTDWMKLQTKNSLSILNNIPNRQFYIDKRVEFDNRKSFSVSNINVTENDLYFYIKKKSSENTSKLFYRNKKLGKEIELFNPENFKREENINYQINYIKPNYDGSKIVIALTESGKEISEMIIYDVKKNKILPDIITNSWPSDGGGISWLSDNNSFIYLHYPIIDPNSQLFLKGMQSVVYHIGQDPKKLNILLSKNNNPNLNIKSEDFPIVNLPEKDCKYLLGFIAGATKFQDTYFLPVVNFRNKNKWKLLFNKDEKISDFIIKEDRIIFISEKNGINAVYYTSLNDPNFKNPTLIIPTITNEVISGLYNLKDGFLFKSSKNGVQAKLYLYNSKKVKSLNLPIPAGNISITTKSILSNNFWIICDGWKNDSERYKYDFSNQKFIVENIAPTIDYPEFKDIITEEIVVKSHDGLEIPLSLIYKKDIQRNKLNPLLIDAYGAYGTINSPYFAKTYLLWALQGGVVAIAHVRGGGEKGDKWHEGGLKEKKSNSWKDLISCAEYMIKENYTSSGKIAIWGASAGGITIGRAMTERPDLFKAVIIDAGLLNTVRIEAMPNGLNSVKELGQINNEKEFKGLLEMDSFHHIIKGVKYPATLITSGINDPRVAPWMPSKFVAKLQSFSSSINPIFLKIDYEGGHGSDIPIAQKYSNLADVFAFAFWQLGHPDYQTKEQQK